MAVWPLTTWALWAGNAPSQGCVLLKISAVGSRPQVLFCGITAMDTLAQLSDPGLTTRWRRLWVRESPSGGRYTMLHAEERTSVIFPCPVDGTGFYMMASTGADILSAGQTTVLASPVHPGNAKTECVQFWYYMGGETPGEITWKHMISGDRKKPNGLHTWICLQALWHCTWSCWAAGGKRSSQTVWIREARGATPAGTSRAGARPGRFLLPFILRLFLAIGSIISCAESQPRWLGTLILLHSWSLRWLELEAKAATLQLTTSLFQPTHVNVKVRIKNLGLSRNDVTFRITCSDLVPPWTRCY